MIFLISLILSIGSIDAKESKVCENFRGTGLNEETVIKYREKLLSIIQRKDFNKFAQELRYPFTLRIKPNKKKKKPKQKFIINSADELIKKYKKMIDLSFVLKGLQSEKFRIICNSQGVGYLNGRVWVMAEHYHKNKDLLKIVAINGL